MPFLENIKPIDEMEMSSFGQTTNWKDLNKWFKGQENYFRLNDFESEQQRIEHIIWNIDVRHWNKLEKYFKFNHSGIKYLSMKTVLSNKAVRMFDPKMEQFSDRVDGQIDRFNMINLDLQNMLIWLKKLRGICDGQASTGYLVAKLLDRVVDDQLEVVCAKLTKEIVAYIQVYEMRIKQSKNIVGKVKKKELNELAEIQETIKIFLE